MEKPLIKTYPRLHAREQRDPSKRWYGMWEVHMILCAADEKAPHMWLEWGHFNTKGEMWAATSKFTMGPRPLNTEGVIQILDEVGYFPRPSYIQCRL